MTAKARVCTDGSREDQAIVNIFYKSSIRVLIFLILAFDYNTIDKSCSILTLLKYSENGLWLTKGMTRAAVPESGLTKHDTKGIILFSPFARFRIEISLSRINNLKL